MATIILSKKALQTMLNELEETGMKGISISSPIEDNYYNGTIKLVEHMTSLNGYHIRSKFDVEPMEKIGRYEQMLIK